MIRFHLIDGPFDGARGEITWRDCPSVIWAYRKGTIPMISKQSKGVPYTCVHESEREVTYQYSGAPSGLPVERETVTA